jgi:cytochrome c biogenesis protein CcmG/thiol:disulfide interchange protein DsbE
VRRALAIALLGAALAGCDPPFDPPPAAAATVREPAPEFTLESLDGSQVSLASLRGKPVLVDFWATWCGPCEDTIPVLVEFQRKYTGRVHVLGVSVDWERDAVAPYAREIGMNYPVLYGDEGLAIDYGAPGFPTLYVIDAQGQIASAHVGVMTLPELEASVAPLLAAD